MGSAFLVFLSGAINDRTKPFRALVKREVERTGWAYVWVFEKEPAHPDLEESYLSVVDRSDVFVLCIWDDITEVVRREFERAGRAGVPRFVFLADADSANENLHSFLQNISQELKWEKCCQEELPSAVQRALVNHLIDVHRRRFLRETYEFTPERLKDNAYAIVEPNVPSSEHSAALLAIRVIPGRIVRALPFFDKQDGRSRIAVLAEKAGFPGLESALLLEEFGGGFRIEWESERLACIGAWKVQPEWFGAEDVDGDLRHEVFFAEGSHGTGSGADVFYLYVPKRQQLFSVTVEETRDPYYRTRVVPCRELTETQNEVYLRALELRMRTLGVMVEMSLPDESPDVLWYMDNGFLKSGRVKVRRFPGPPSFGASWEAKHSDGDLEWFAYFKGPVMGHDLTRNEHFVIYGPETMYNWPTCFASNQDYVWFGTRGDGVFQYDKRHEVLAQIPPGSLRDCPADVSTLELKGPKLVVNGTHEFEVPWR